MENSVLIQNTSLDVLTAAIGNAVAEEFRRHKIQQAAPTKTYLTRKQVCQICRITYPTLNRYTKLGILQSYAIGSRVLYVEGEVTDALQKMPNQRNRR